MLLFSLENLSSHSVKKHTLQELVAFQNPRPESLSKEEFRAWCARPDTSSVFFSVWSGVEERQRVCSANPATLLHGIVGDFDSVSAENCIGDLAKSCGMLPSYVSGTFSKGKVRAIWEFESPIIVGNEDVTEKFLKALDKRLRFSKALPGFDKCSIDPNQYFELGTNWRPVPRAKPIPLEALEVALIEAAKAGKIVSADVIDIPLEKVAEAVQAKFPGRWKKAFEPGQRGPLFWIPDGIDREGCAVTEQGMICFSDRAQSNFLNWKQILGSEFVSEFEEEIIGRAASVWHFDGRNYYRKIRNIWTCVAKDDARIQLKALGVSDQRRRGRTTSDIEDVLNHIQLHRRVDAAVPIPFRSEDVVWIAGKALLNTNAHKVVEPAPEGEGLPEKFPWLYEWINNAFLGIDANGIHAKYYFLGWMYQFYSSALVGKIRPGQVLILVGPASIGKTFINTRLIGGMVGGSTDALDILLKDVAFNKGAGEVGHWRVDDPPSKGTYAERATFTFNLKRKAANPSFLYQPKYHDAIELPSMGRICGTFNDEPDSISLIPSIDSSTADKFMLHYLSHEWIPHWYPDHVDNNERMETELPYFLRWLLEWGQNEIPECLIDHTRPRFGVKTWHHPELLIRSSAESPEYALKELLEIWAGTKTEQDPVKTRYTASELLQEIRTLIPEASRELKLQTFGRQLTKLVGKYEKLVEKKIISGIAHYDFKFK